MTGGAWEFRRHPRRNENGVSMWMSYKEESMGRGPPQEVKMVGQVDDIKKREEHAS